MTFTPKRVVRILRSPGRGEGPLVESPSVPRSSEQRPINRFHKATAPVL